MTPGEVRALVEAIRRVESDPEDAHGREDALHEAVLSAIADGVPDAAELAAEALKTKELKFPRWTA